MSKADQQFKKLCTEIITNGMSSEGEKVRPRWPDDNSPAHTTKVFGYTTVYDLSEEFPAITYRKTAIKTAATEMLWIWQQNSNNIHDLKAHIWDEWADENGSIGKTYGYQIGVKHHYPEGEATQIEHLIYELKNNPFDRGKVVTMWCVADLNEMRLRPCLHTVTFSVTKDKTGKKYLNAVLDQRSNDVLTANNWNVCQYAILVMMLAQACDMLPGKLLHTIADAHIYDRHIPLVKELLERPTYKAPKVTLNPEVKDFFKFTADDIIIEKYKHGEQISIPVAV